MRWSVQCLLLLVGGAALTHVDRSFRRGRALRAADDISTEARIQFIPNVDEGVIPDVSRQRRDENPRPSVSTKKNTRARARVGSRAWKIILRGASDRTWTTRERTTPVNERVNEWGRASTLCRRRLTRSANARS